MIGNVIQKVRLGKNAGIICLILSVLDLVMSFFIDANKPDIFTESIQFIISVGLTITYSLLLLGIYTIVKERNDQQFIKDIKNFLTITIIIGVIVAVTSFSRLITPTILITLAIVYFTLGVGAGIVAIRLAKDFQRLETQYGNYAHQASRWHKISGWLLATILLLPLGGLLSIIADYYMWKVLQQYLKKK